ncbi:MAG: ArsA family ATPase [Acidimicrobiia bacterium]
MDPLQFFAASRLLVVAGKGGVGKTTVTAVVARAAAESGQRVLVIDVEGKAGLAGLLGGEPDAVLPYDETVLVEGLGPEDSGEIRGRTITAGTALIEYLDDHGLRRVSKRLADTGVLDVVSTAAPGIEDILVLGKVKQLERAGTADLIVLDGPAAGHAISFLEAASALLDAVNVGPIQAQAKDVIEMLSDPTRCQVLLVTMPEETPVNELIETSYALEDRIGVALAPVVVNGVYAPRALDPSTTDDPDLRAAAEFRLQRCASQVAQLQRLTDALPLPQIVLPFVFTAGLRPEDVESMVPLFLDAVRAIPT